MALLVLPNLSKKDGTRTLLLLFDWTKSKQGRKIGSLEKTKRERFPVVSFVDAPQPIKDSLNAPGNAQFDPDHFYIFAYIGKKKLPDGTILTHYRIVNKEKVHTRVLARKAELEADQSILQKLAQIQSAKIATKKEKKRIRDADPEGIRKRPKASSSKN
jgi:hypothetical protein